MSDSDYEELASQLENIAVHGGHEFADNEFETIRHAVTALNEVAADQKGTADADREGLVAALTATDAISIRTLGPLVIAAGSAYKNGQFFIRGAHEHGYRVALTVESAALVFYVPAEWDGERVDLGDIEPTEANR